MTCLLIMHSSQTLVSSPQNAEVSVIALQELHAHFTAPSMSSPEKSAAAPFTAEEIVDRHPQSHVLHGQQLYDVTTHSKTLPPESTLATTYTVRRT